jgi:DNA gyrase subunit B
VDGAHIRTLLLTLFYRYFPQLITAGNLFIAQPPLYRVSSGKEFAYCFTEAERDLHVKEFLAKKEARGAAAASKKAAKKAEINEALDEQPMEGDAEATTSIGGVVIQRYKGLGEMNAEQLWETTMNPETRTMLKVNIDDAEKADNIFDVLMGNEVEPRKRFIQTHAKSVKNLDI